MSKRCPFEPLIVARRARRDGAMAEVVRRRERVAQCEAARDAVRTRLDELVQERKACGERLCALVTEGASPLEPGRLHERRALLAIRIGETTAELNAAERALEVARNELSEAVAEFFRAEAKLDALEKQKQQWLRDRDARRESIDEAMVEDLVVHRVANGR